MDKDQREFDAGFYDPTLAGNERIEEVIRMFHEDPSERMLTAVCMSVRDRMMADGHLIFPADMTVTPEGQQQFSFKTVEVGGRFTAIVGFTSREEQEKAPPSPAVSNFIDVMIEMILQADGIDGLMLNPWGESIFLDKEDLTLVYALGIERYS